MSRLEVAVALLRRGGRIFLQRRSMSSAFFPGLWEFPGGKREEGESPMDTILRELEEELDWRPLQIDPLPGLIHSYGSLEVELHAFLCEGDAPPATELAWGWFKMEEVLRLRVPDATLELVVQLRARIG